MNSHSNNTYNNQPNVLDKAAAALPGHQTNAGSAGNVAPQAHHSHAGNPVGTGFDNTHSGVGSHSNTHSALGSNTHSGLGSNTHSGLGSNNHSGLGSNTHSNTHSSGPNIVDKAAAALPGHQTNAGSAGNVAPSSHTGHSSTGLGHDSHSHSTTGSYLPGSNTHSTGTHLAGNNTHGHSSAASHIPGSTGTHSSTGSHLPGSTGAHSSTASHLPDAHSSNSVNKPSVGDKISGKIEEVVGKMTKDPVKIQEGVLKQEVGKEGLAHGAGAGAGVAGGRY